MEPYGRLQRQGRTMSHPQALRCLVDYLVNALCRGLELKY